MTFFPDLIKQEISKGLPGEDVQWMMASSDRMQKDFPRRPGPGARQAAVLVLLYPADGKITTVFMQRHNYKGVHGGQISFPGGKFEHGDENLVSTAIREAHEETGANLDSLSVLGTLTPLLVHVSNTNVVPVAGWLNSRPSFIHQKEEVLFLIEAPIDSFLDDSVVKTRSMTIRDSIIDVKYFDFNGHIIWGATAMILNEFLALLRRNSISACLRG